MNNFVSIHILIYILNTRLLGCKWTIALSFITYMPFIIAQFYPRMWTLVPGGAAVGLGGGPLWCAKCTYLTVIAEAYSTLIGSEKKTDAMVVRFFGMFFLFYQMAQVWGNLISSSVLSYGEIALNETIDVAAAATQHASVRELCGARFCPGISAASNPNLQPPDSSKINLLMAIFLGLMVMASVLVMSGVDSLKR